MIYWAAATIALFQSDLASSMAGETVFIEDYSMRSRGELNSCHIRATSALDDEDAPEDAVTFVDVRLTNIKVDGIIHLVVGIHVRDTVPGGESRTVSVENAYLINPDTYETVEADPPLECTEDNGCIFTVGMDEFGPVTGAVLQGRAIEVGYTRLGETYDVITTIDPSDAVPESDFEPSRFLTCAEMLTRPEPD